MVCKWGYLAHENRWDTEMYREIGIGDALEKGMCGQGVLPLGACAGGVTEEASLHLGIPQGCSVSVNVPSRICHLKQASLALISRKAASVAAFRRGLCSESISFARWLWPRYDMVFLPCWSSHTVALWHFEFLIFCADALALCQMNGPSSVIHAK